MKPWTLMIRGAGVLLLGSACARLQKPPPPSQPPLLAFEHVLYDGHTVSGRALVGARAPTTVDRRLIENVSLSVDRVTDCATGAAFPPLVADFLPEPPTRDDLVTLNEGEWFGRDVSFVVFAEPFTPPEGPACIELSLSLQMTGSQPVTLRLKAERAAEAQGKDGGASGEGVPPPRQEP
ncbi:hypothetical protein D7X74_30080 [Corallococcus sp. CA047B]|uniref:hypothetical protein n=1 Tax=Corallococcus sp. CA047B TaxID=2316729 RepID=UPI000EA24179|nr:hypothetical protein [Corallococcus sp. CA047B]RKH09166.1 hypothetical protein D7X74_30080 [Corallococcus sp. CA047B]